MLTEIYVEALLTDDEAADQVGRIGIRGRLMRLLRFWLGGCSFPKTCKQRRQREEDNKADEKLIVRLRIFQLVADPIFHILVLADYERP